MFFEDNLQLSSRMNDTEAKGEFYLMVDIGNVSALGEYVLENWLKTKILA